MVSFTNHYNAILMDRFPSKTKIGKDSWYFNNSLLCKPDFFLSAKAFLSLLKTQSTTAIQQVTGGKTLNLVLKKLLELVLKIQGNIRISILKGRLQNLYKKENFKLEIKPMIENLKEWTLENKQAKSSKLGANIRSKLEEEKCFKTFKVLDRQNMQNQTKFGLYKLMA